MPDIAIIGMGCRFPGADDPDEYWGLIAHKRHAIGVVPDERWSEALFFDPKPGIAGKTYTRWAGLIEDVDRFDAACFGISAVEAERMDPQQRLLLEVTRDALESAGLPRDRLAGMQAGVFVGISTFDYTRVLPRDPESIDLHSGTGTALSIAANRLSYVFDLRGPSVAVDTACSSSLVALHLACRSLAAGECSVAIAGGVNLLLAPDLMIAFSAARMMAADGRCKAFDAAADGYVRGEGCGMVVLRRLADARADGDHVLAVVRGSAVNQDGRSNGLTAPNGPAQERVIAAALKDAGVEAARIAYVEAHGTGTSLGDPIEAMALGAVLGQGRPPHAPLLLGSAKTNIGHLEAAAGMAGVIKTVQALGHRRIPPSLNYETPNPRIPFEELGLRVATDLMDWPTEGPALVGVSSFGFGGTNAHVVLQAAPEGKAPTAGALRVCILPISAPHTELLIPLALAHAGALERLDAVALADYCYSASVRRSHYDHRLVVTGADARSLASALRALAAGQGMAGAWVGRRPPSGRDDLLFAFAGGARQARALASAILREHPAARRVLAECDSVLEAEGVSILDLLASGGPDGDSPADHPLMVAAGLAVAELWASCGLRPSAVWGCGVGEITAAAVAGALGREEAMCLAWAWGQTFQQAGPDQAGAHLAGALAWLRPGCARLPLHSAALGRPVEEQELDAAHWSGVCGRSATGRSAENNPPAGAGIIIGGDLAFAPTLGRLYAHGHDLDWQGVFPEGGTFIPVVPLTPFRRQRYWRGLPPGQDAGTPARPGSPRPARLPTALPVWQARVATARDNFAGGHFLNGVAVLPMGVGLSLAVEAARKELGLERVQLSEVAFHRLIPTRDEESLCIQITFAPPESDGSPLKVHVAEVGTEHAGGSWSLWMTARAHGAAPAEPSLSEARARCGRTRPETLARLPAPLPGGNGGDPLAPLVTEAMPLFRSLAPGTTGAVIVPAAIGAVVWPTLGDPAGAECWAYAGLDANGQSGDLVLWDQGGRFLCRLDQIRFRPLEASALLVAATAPMDMVYRLAWRQLPLPSPRPTCADMVARMAATEPAARAQLLAAETAAFAQRLDPVCAQFVADALRGLGWHPRPGDSVRTEQVTALCGIVPRHRRLTTRLLEMLAEDGCLSPTPEGWSVVSSPPDGDVMQAWRGLSADFPTFHHEIHLLGVCGQALAEVLSGRQDPLALLFPDGRGDLLEGLYGSARTMQAANALAAEAVAACMVPGRRCRVLEIGGGTGGTTGHVLDRLTGQPVDYLFTDISPAFLHAAQERHGTRLGSLGTFAARRLDIEADPAGQGFGGEKFEVIIIANVLHATQDLRRSLDHVRDLLAPGGTVVVVEQTFRQRLLDLVFGLTTGWWRFTDTELRPDYPLLTPERWQAVFEQTGFHIVHSRPGLSVGHGQDIFLAQARSAGRFLILGGLHSAAEALSAELAGLGETAVIGKAGLDHALASQDWRGVVLLAGSGEVDIAHEVALRAALEHSGTEILHALKTLRRRPNPPPLLVVTHNAVAAAEDDVPDPVGAALWGLGRTAAIEMPGLWGGLIDTDGTPTSLRALARDLAAGGIEREVALRGESRLAPRLERRVTADEEKIRLSADAAYLVTGGFGSLGLAVAEWLASQGARHLVLCGRSVPGAAARKRMAAVAASGATVTTVVADVADAEAMAKLMARFGADLAVLKGIVHAAGTTADGVLADLDPALIMDAHMPKAVGAWLLNSLSAGADLDFLAFFSSASALFGQPGSGLYTAANAFLDAFAAKLAKEGRKAFSIGWAPWAGTRMAETVSGEQKRRWRQSGMLPLEPSAALAILGSALADTAPVVAVMAVDWALVAHRDEGRTTLFDELVQAHPEGRNLPRKGPAEPSSPAASAFVEELSRCHAGERPHRIERYLRGVVARVLNIPDDRAIGAQEGFQQLGMDSLTSLTLLDVIQRECGLRLPATTLFDHSNIGALARLLDDELSGAAPSAPEPPRPAAPIRDAAKPAAGVAGLFDGIADLDDLAAWEDIGANLGER